MNRFRNTIAAGIIALTAAAPVAAQAGQDEEIFALGALAGVAATVLFGGAVAGAVTANRSNDVGTGPLAVGNDHVGYCQARYKTYRVSDNTFQPNNGPRRECVSPTSN